MRIDIPDVPPSLNKTLRMHWARRKRMNEDWQMQIFAEARPPKEAPLKKVTVHITLFHSRMYDKDNGYGAVKPIVDALKYWNYIKDDTGEWLELHVQQQKCPHKLRHTIIDIQPS